MINFLAENFETGFNDLRSNDTNIQIFETD